MVVFLAALINIILSQLNCHSLMLEYLYWNNDFFRHLLENGIPRKLENLWVKTSTEDHRRTTNSVVVCHFIHTLILVHTHTHTYTIKFHSMNFVEWLANMRARSISLLKNINNTYTMGMFYKMPCTLYNLYERRWRIVLPFASFSLICGFNRKKVFRFALFSVNCCWLNGY